MEVFVARQPVFNQQETIFAYELLYRNNNQNSYPNINGDQATTEVIINSFLNIGIETLLEGRPCFINFTEKLLSMKLPEYVCPDKVIVDLVETTCLSESLLDSLQELKRSGYKIAIEGFVINENSAYSIELLRNVNYVKVDFRSTTRSTREKVEKLARTYGKSLIAERIETEEEYDEAKEKGYTFFQGYYFAKPSILSTYEIPPFFTSYIEMRTFISSGKKSFNEMVELIERDPSLSYKILKLINSPSNKLKKKIFCIREAIEHFGSSELEKWIYVLAVREESMQSPIEYIELAKLCLIRGKMCEGIARLRKGHTDITDGYFMTGVLSSLTDSILALPIEQMVKQISLNKKVVHALKGKQNEYKDVLDLAVAVEKAKWKIIEKNCRKLKIEEKDLFKGYAEAMNWSKQMFDTKECLF